MIGYGTKFTTELAPKRQILLPKSLGAPLAEVIEVISDTEARIKKEFGGDSGTKTSKLRDRCAELGEGKGVEYKVLPHVDQADMYGAVYKRLINGESIAIFPEGMSSNYFRF